MSLVKQPADLSQNSADQAPTPVEPGPAPALVFTTLAPKGRAPGLVVRSHLKAGPSPSPNFKGWIRLF
jgi:hypothetical protein